MDTSSSARPKVAASGYGLIPLDVAAPYVLVPPTTFQQLQDDAVARGLSVRQRVQDILVGVYPP